MDKPKVEIKIKLVETPTDPPIKVAQVTLQTDTGVFQDTLGSPGELRTYLRGAKAMAASLGRQDLAVTIPDVPREMQRGF